MFRRPRFRPIRRGIIANGPPALRQAHQLLASDQFLEAAEAFERLARGAQERGIPQDAQLYITAGYCRLQLKQVDLATSHFKQGLLILSGRGRPIRFQRAAQRCIIDLSQLGYSQQANEIMQLTKDSMPEVADNASAAVPISRASLPTTCPACGGSIRSDEVDWIDETTVECSWCGSTVAVS